MIHALFLASMFYLVIGVILGIWGAIRWRLIIGRFRSIDLLGALLVVAFWPLPLWVRAADDYRQWKRSAK